MCGILFVLDTTKQVESINDNLNTLEPRGPDHKSIVRYELDSCNLHFGFTRLSIVGLSDDGMQPFMDSDCITMCNGEVYNYEELIKRNNIIVTSSSDCAVLTPLYKKYGFRQLIEKHIDAEFAMIIYDKETSTLYAARDRYGVRPLFLGYTKDHDIVCVASELKAINNICDYVEPFDPRTYLKIKLNNICMKISTKKYNISLRTQPIIYPSNEIIKTLLTDAVKKRLGSDRPIGFLLSGGLDSSLIVAIAAKILGPDAITCFTIGFDDSPDVIAARDVTSYLGIKNHHIVPFDAQMGIENIEQVIKIIESYDVTTVRASVPQYIMAKYIRDNTDIKVLFSGEGSDEIHGSYRYFRDAPAETDFDKERHRLLQELYMFDNLRTDRTMAGCGLEVRVPFLDFTYVNYVMNILGRHFMYDSDCIEKKLVRDSFQGYLPDHILYRSKEAFSDAVSNKSIKWYKCIINSIDEDERKSLDSMHWSHIQPKTIDAKYFRNIFDRYYHHPNVIGHYWLPRFQTVEIFDPSATILDSY